jgi:putative ABC transport system permease protein
MLLNNIKIMLRNIYKNKSYSFISIAGLVIGMTCFILIMIFVQYELSYDNFHKDNDQIYRVVCQLPGEQFGMSEDVLAVSPAPLSAAVEETFPEVKSSTKINSYRRLLLSYNDKHFFERGIFADKNFLYIFNFPLLEGNINTVLDNPQKMVISQRVAQKFFGKENPVGKVLTCSLGEFTIAGIIENAPENSHIQFDWIFPFESQFDPDQRKSRMNRWNWDDYYSYLKLKPGTNLTAFEEKLNSFIKTKYTNWEMRMHFRYFLQPLTQVHLTSGYRYELGIPTDITLIRLFSAVAFFILLIACINVVNLLTANASKRAKEVGIRKVVGSLRRQLFWQFTGESLLISILSMGLALVLVELILPDFNQFVERSIHWKEFITLTGIVSLFGIVLFTGLASGLYPSFVLSSMKPIKILTKRNAGQKNKVDFRNILVLFQFAIAIILMISSLIIFRQLQYIKEKNIGFDREQVLVMNVADPGLRENFEAFKYDLHKNSNIIDISTSSQLPINIGSATGSKFLTDEGEKRLVHYQYIGVDYNFVDVFKMNILEGRNFSKSFGSDSGRALIVNEAFVKQMGWSDPVGKQMPEIWSGPDDAELEIVGIVEDFHARSLRLEIKPVIMKCMPNSYWIHIRLQAETRDHTISEIENLYNKYNVRFPFQHFFLDDQYNQMYQSEQKLGQILMYSNILAIFIACMGIFGLATHVAERRTKEIGIRKVLGASVTGIISLLSWNFARWVLLANIIAWPVAYIGMTNWLQNFSYRTEVDYWIFILAAMVTIFIALTTIIYHAIKTAVANPVQSLRYE